MVAKVSTGKDIVGLINYNEQKVYKGTARLIDSENMLLGVRTEKLTKAQKINVFEKLIEGKVGRKLDKTTFHVSLNFDPSEKPSDLTLKVIAREYMERMGYTNQPYLVYRHEDTKHSHLHIVSVNVDRNGNKIDRDLYKQRSERARKAIEIKFGLIRAEGRQQKLEAIQRVAPEVVKYGVSETKADINNVVMNVIADFAVTSVKEFQDILGHFNVKAELIKKTTPNGEHEGLVYSMTNNEGKRVGVGIKASAFDSKPTLANLLIKFEANEGPKKDRAKQTGKIIAGILLEYKHITQEEFTKRLAEKKIITRFHQGEKGTFGVSYIDLERKAVYKGSDLGKEYGWNSLKDRFSNQVERIETPAKALGKKAPVAAVELGVFLSQEQRMQIISKLATIYSQAKKHPTEGAFFESIFIKQLGNVDLATPLLRALPNLNQQQAEFFVNHFIAHKREKLPEIEGKEKVLFAAQAQTALQFLSRVPQAAASDKVQFLASYNLILRLEGRSWSLHHMKGNHLRYELPAAEGESLAFGLPAGGTGQSVNYTKDEKGFIASVAAGNPDAGNMFPDTFNHQHFKKLLSDKDYIQVTAHLTKKYISRLQAEVVKGDDALQIAKVLRERGVLLVPVKEAGRIKDYKVKYYQYPATDLLISTELRKKLLAAGYQQEPPAITARYIIVVDIKQGMDRQDTQSIYKALSYLESRNPGLHAALKKGLAPMEKELEGVSGKDRDKVLDRMGTAVIERLEKYPTDNLLKPQEPEQGQGLHNDYGNDKMPTGALPVKTGILSSGSNADSEGPGRARKPKKKKRNPWD